MEERALPSAERGPVDRLFVMEIEKAGSVWEAALRIDVGTRMGSCEVRRGVRAYGSERNNFAEGVID
jgi:hypothetical protein